MLQFGDDANHTLKLKYLQHSEFGEIVVLLVALG